MSNSTKFTQVWKDTTLKIMHLGKEQAPRGLPTVMVPQNSITVDMRHPVLLAPGRKLSYTFMAAEAYWILSGDDSVAGIEPYNKHITKFSDDGERFFGAYGPKILDQLDHVVTSLLNDPDSRQAGLTIWRENPPKTKDVPCTVAIFASIVSGKLNLSVYMRSSDVWLGLPYDVFTFSMLGHLICCRLNDTAVGAENIVTPGNLYLTAANQHVYKSNWDDANLALNAERAQPAVDAPTPPELHMSEGSLMTTLKNLRDSKPGSFIRWWEHGGGVSNYKDVQNFHSKFGVPTAEVPSFLGPELYEFRRKFMQEELVEFQDAYTDSDMEGAADALIDLVYVAMGTADMMGLPWQKLWDEVQRANMSKVRAESADQSTRGTAFDVIKPTGWTPPDHVPALRGSGIVVGGQAPWFPTFTGYSV